MESTGWLTPTEHYPGAWQNKEVLSAGFASSANLCRNRSLADSSKVIFRLWTVPVSYISLKGSVESLDATERINLCLNRILLSFIWLMKMTMLNLSLNHLPKLLAEQRWWQSNGEKNIIAQLACFFNDVVPHAAATERIFSLMGILHSKERHLMSVVSTGMMAAVKVFYQQEGSEPKGWALLMYANSQVSHLQVSAFCIEMFQTIWPCNCIACWW